MAKPAAPQPAATGDLPRLLYFADVPVEDYMHGSVQLYRLLQSYPPDRLLIVEGPARSQEDRRLPGVAYRQNRDLLQRLARSRFGDLFGDLYAWRGGDGVAALTQQVGDFRPQAVLSLLHGYQWVTAANFARRHGLPLHLIAHDQLERSFLASDRVKARIGDAFARVYPTAAGRFCVSPRLAEAYEAETGAAAQVLYPVRRPGFEAPTSVSPRVASPGRPFTFAFAGSIWGKGLIEAIELERAVAQQLGAQVMIFGPYTREDLAARGLSGENLIVGGLASAHEFLERLRTEADALLCSVAFDPASRLQMELCFPSKLVEYTAVGLPILAHGPPTSAAVRWAIDNPGVAAIADNLDPKDLRQVMGRLIDDQPWRHALAGAAMALGAEQFAAKKGEQILFAALAGQQP